VLFHLRPLEAAWLKATREAADEFVGDGSLAGEPEDWPGYELKRARLWRAAKRLHGLLVGAGPDVELLSEQALSGADGVLRGRPDLLVRSANGLWLIDYKTGPVLSRDTREPRESYVRQLQLYASLAADALGEWPRRAFLLPLDGPFVEVDIDPASCGVLAQQAVDLLGRFNASAGGPQPASPARVEALGQTLRDQ
jgi:hypothetical protein